MQTLVFVPVWVGRLIPKRDQKMSCLCISKYFTGGGGDGGQIPTPHSHGTFCLSLLVKVPLLVRHSHETIVPCLYSHLGVPQYRSSSVTNDNSTQPSLPDKVFPILFCRVLSLSTHIYTDKKENKIFLIYKEI
jgi:hypothetical protein